MKHLYHHLYQVIVILDNRYPIVAVSLSTFAKILHCKINNVVNGQKELAKLGLITITKEIDPMGTRPDKQFPSNVIELAPNHKQLYRDIVNTEIEAVKKEIEAQPTQKSKKKRLLDLLDLDLL